MEKRIRNQAPETTNSNLMTPLEVLFGTSMAAASIYAAWCTVSLLFLALS